MKERKIPISLEELNSIPRNEALEKEVLGALMSSSMEAIEDVSSIISTESFYTPINKTIYDAIIRQMAQHKTTDTLGVAMALKSDGKLDEIGGSVYLAQLASRCSSTAFLMDNARSLKQYEMKREIFFLSDKMKAMSVDPMCEAQELIEETEKKLTEMQTKEDTSVVSIEDNLSEFYNWLLDQQTRKVAISSGLEGLDAILDGGFRGPDLIILGARPSMGKTALATFFAQNAARLGKRVYFASIEMTTTQLLSRMVARNGISTARMRTGRLSSDEWKEVEAAMTEIRYLPIVIDSSNNVRYLSHIKNTARRLKRKGGLDMIVIDYLQLVKTNQQFERRYLEVGYITGELKSLAKELGVPVILLAQVSRATAGREMELPRMDDLRESGDIEQDADIIIFPHRPSEVNKDACDKLGRSWKNRGLLFVAKNREGNRNVMTYFEHDDQFKDIWDDFTSIQAAKDKAL